MSKFCFYYILYCTRIILLLFLNCLTQELYRLDLSLTQLEEKFRKLPLLYKFINVFGKYYKYILQTCCFNV